MADANGAVSFRRPTLMSMNDLPVYLTLSVSADQWRQEVRSPNWGVAFRPSVAKCYVSIVQPGSKGMPILMLSEK